jgi:AraC-like DNA-binding protein
MSATIAAVLAPDEQVRVEAAGSGCFAVLARDTIPEAIRLVRERAVDALLLSVSRCGPEQVPALARLVEACPGLPTVALLSHHSERDTEALLRLGATGVRQVVDVTTPNGWRRLREMVSQPAGQAAARIQAAVLSELDELTPDGRLFIEALVRLAPEATTVRRLARVLAVGTSTLVSRFARHGLPSPKSYLAAMRLLHAAALFERGALSVADVAYRLDYSSPQSFGRHLRAMLGVTASEFRRRIPFPDALGRFQSRLVIPYREAWRTFHPLVGRMP